MTSARVHIANLITSYYYNERQVKGEPPVRFVTFKRKLMPEEAAAAKRYYGREVTFHKTIRRGIEVYRLESREPDHSWPLYRTTARWKIFDEVLEPLKRR